MNEQIFDLTGGKKREPECRFWRVMNPTQTETVDSRRYDEVSECERRNEQIFDLTGGKKV